MSDTTSLSAQVDKLNIAESNTPAQSEPSELVAVVDDLLNQLTTKFSTVSAEIVAKSRDIRNVLARPLPRADFEAVDEMTKRLDALESQIQAGNVAAKAESSDN